MSMPKHITTFNNAEVTGCTPYEMWEAIQHGALVCTDIDNRIASLRDPISNETCFVFWDEAAQMSMPYATADDAKEALTFYIKNCL